jgi:hypothetical protein
MTDQPQVENVKYLSKQIDVMSPWRHEGVEQPVNFATFKLSIKTNRRATG